MQNHNVFRNVLVYFQIQLNSEHLGASHFIFFAQVTRSKDMCKKSKAIKGEAAPRPRKKRMESEVLMASGAVPNIVLNIALQHASSTMLFTLKGESSHKFLSYSTLKRHAAAARHSWKWTRAIKAFLWKADNNGQPCPSPRPECRNNVES